jgi:AraC family L-rhamnose operon transcriptional activator RhaR
MIHQLRRAAVFGGGLAVAAEPLTVLPEAQTMHSHDFVELVVVTSGEGVHRSVAGEQPLRRGSVVVLRPGDWHAYGRCRKLSVWNLYVGVEVFTGHVGLLGRDVVQTSSLWTFDRSGRNAGTRLPTLDAETLTRVEGWLAELHRTAWDDRGSAAVRVGLLLCILGQCAPGQSAPGQGSPGQFEPGTARPTASAATHPAVTTALQILEQDIGAQWTLEDLCAVVHVSPSYLSRCFSSAVGMPPMAYLNRLRAERAAALLLDSDRPVSSIGESVGWVDPSYASRRFRAAFGLSPVEYRRTLRLPAEATATPTRRDPGTLRR